LAMRFGCEGLHCDDREQQKPDRGWGTMTPRRYTRDVGHWSVRLVSIVLTMMLGGGSSVASLCAALCFDEAASATAGAPSGETSTHHHGGSRDGHLATVAQTSEHHHDASADSEPAAELATGSTASMSCAGDCCKFLARPRLALSADRADSGLVPALGTVPSAAFAPDFDHHPFCVTRGSPPGDASARSHVVLRI
jgi:hypothetical protein